MLSRSLLIYAVCAVVLIAAVALAGCPAGPETQDPTALIPPEEPPVEPGGLEAAEGGEETAEVPTDFEWTATPTVEMIPSGTIRGVMNGKPFEAKTVRIEKDDEGIYELNISNTAVEGEDPTDMIMGDDAWQLTFSGAEGEPGEWTWAVSDEKDFDKEHVFYYYAQGEGKGPMSVNSPWGAALQITEWTVQEPEEGADTFHTIIGNVKGKVLLVMDDQEKSWVGGEFDAVYYEF